MGLMCKVRFQKKSGNKFGALHFFVHMTSGRGFGVSESPW